MIGLIDSTLREGEQMAGVYFSLAQKLDIVKKLGAVGIEEIELGSAIHDPDMPELIKQARETAPNVRLAIWCRCLPKDIMIAARLKPDVLSLCIPVSDLHIHRRLLKDRGWVLSQIALAASCARAAGVRYVSLGLEDATRTSYEFLEAALERAVASGVDRVRFSDTLGQAEPADIMLLARKFAGTQSVQIGIHTHNDFGMATANAITAMEAGFDWADVSVLGLGERSGIARLEEVVTYLRVRKLSSRYDTKRLRPLCEFVAEAAGVHIYPHHPAVGAKLFVCESGLHVDGLAKDTQTYEPYPPELVNATRDKVLGKKSGSGALQDKMSEMGIAISGVTARLLISQVRTQSRLLGRPLRDSEITSLFTGAQT